MSSQNEIQIEDILASIRSYVATGNTKDSKEANSEPPLRAEIKEKSSNGFKQKPTLLESAINNHKTDKSALNNNFQEDKNQGLVFELTDEVIEENSIGSVFNESLHNNAHQEPIVLNNPAFEGAEPFDPFAKLESIHQAQPDEKPLLNADQLLTSLVTPMIESWMKENLRPIVEKIVEKEIQKIRGRR